MIVDSSLTVTDRLMTARRIRRSAAVADVPIVLLTSISEPLRVGEVSSLGKVFCINKPVLPLELSYTMLTAMRVDEEPKRDAQPGFAAGMDAREVSILIAEDNPVSSGVLQSMLRTEGFGADVVDDGPAVLDELKSRRYDILLLDCQMPGMDGDEVTQAIREAPGHSLGNPVIVAVTADTTETHRARCLSAGMDDFVPKPVRISFWNR